MDRRRVARRMREPEHVAGVAEHDLGGVGDPVPDGVRGIRTDQRVVRRRDQQRRHRDAVEAVAAVDLQRGVRPVDIAQVRRVVDEQLAARAPGPRDLAGGVVWRGERGCVKPQGDLSVERARQVPRGPDARPLERVRHRARREAAGQHEGLEARRAPRRDVERDGRAERVADEHVPVEVGDLGLDEVGVELRAVEPFGESHRPQRPFVEGPELVEDPGRAREPRDGHDRGWHPSDLASGVGSRPPMLARRTCDRTTPR